MSPTKADNKAEQYQALVDVRNTELQVYWTRYNVQVVLNGGLIVAVLSLDPNRLPGTLTVRAIAVGGIALGVLWFLMTILGKRLLHRWDCYIGKAEAALGLPRVFAELTEVRPRWKVVFNQFTNLTLVAAVVPALCIFFWWQMA